MATSDHENLTITHKMRFDRQKLKQIVILSCATRPLPREMRFDRQKLRKNCDFVWSRSGFPSMISNFDSRKLMKMCDYAEACKSI